MTQHDAPLDSADWTPWRGQPLREDAVHVWLLTLDDAARDQRAARALLTDAERARADRYRVEPPRHVFTSTRAALRCILAAHLHHAGHPTSPRALEITPDAMDKPFAPAHPALQFNVSHSHQRALIAVDPRGLRDDDATMSVGVDIEHSARRTDLNALARHAFSPAERAAVLAASDADTRRDIFFAIWSRKESYIKALGMGLRLDLASFDVSPDPTRACLLATRHDPDALTRWVMHNLPLPGPYAAALTLRAPDAPLRLWTRDLVSAQPPL